jgi:ankyrin repeat protein
MPAVESQFTDEDREDFVLAARYGDLDDVKAYMAQGINVGVKDNNGNTAMHMASANGHTGSVPSYV